MCDTCVRHICAFSDRPSPKPLSKAGSMYGYEHFFSQKKQPSTDGIMFQNIEFKSVINTIKQSDTCIQSSEEDQRYGIHLRYIEI